MLVKGATGNGFLPNQLHQAITWSKIDVPNRHQQSSIWYYSVLFENASDCIV